TALYGWLNQNQPGWEENIGKVCAEELLFDETLAPRKLLSGNDGCYGIALSLSNRSQKVKSLDDYRQELERVEQELEKGKSTVNRLTQELENSLEKVKQRFHPKARELRKANRELDYQIEHHPRQVEEAQLKLNQLQQQAGEERQQRVERLQVELAELTENELAAQQQLEKLEGQLNRQLKTKQRQRQLKVAEQEQLCQRELEQIDVAVAKETGSYQQRKTKVVVDRDSELQSRGVDTGRLHTIEQELVRIDLELEFIEKNRDLVVEYRRDKTDFLDRVKEFKNEQQLVQRQQQQQQQQFDRQRQQRRQQLAELEGQIDILQQELQQIAADR
ncbi:MAG: ATP-binding protein, partial [Thermodesulfobacteriota bacterium]|nr:ATP-binding protein [Thermodesulfobacteriota bacterium]